MQMEMLLAITRISKRHSGMSRIKELFTNSGSAVAYAIISAIFTLIPEDVFKNGIILCDWSWIAIVTTNRIITCLVIFMIANVIYYCHKKYRKSVLIFGKNFSVSIEYGDILKVKKGKMIINFDECYTTKIGQMPGDIKPTSVCGQYLTKYPIDDMPTLLQKAGVQSIGFSKYNKIHKYKLGTIVPRDNFLLMAFTKLDKDGLSRMTYEDYLECLNTLWKQIDKYHGTDDVYIPILGSKITRMDKELSQQELLDVMLASYRLSPYKLKLPFMLHVVCVSQDGFSLNNIEGSD